MEGSVAKYTKKGDRQARQSGDKILLWIGGIGVLVLSILIIILIVI